MQTCMSAVDGSHHRTPVRFGGLKNRHRCDDSAFDPDPDIARTFHGDLDVPPA
jgi:hypothetical protein